MKIGIMGTPVSSGNRGVLALGSSLVNLCAGAAPKAEIVLLLGNRDNRPARFRVAGGFREIPVVNARLSIRSRLRDHLLWIFAMAALYRLLPIKSIRNLISSRVPWINALEESTWVGDVHGGDSFSDIYGIRGFIYTFVINWTVILVKGSIVQFPQTYGPFKSGLSRLLARFLLRRSSVVVARDNQSRKIAQEMAGSQSEVLLSPDVAFSLESIVPTQIEVDPPFVGPMPEDVVGINVNGLMYNGGYTKNNMFGLTLDYPSFLSRLVSELLELHRGEIWLVPHTFAPEGDVESDQEASRKLRASLPIGIQERVRIVTREYDQHEIKGVIRGCDFFVGSRMHSCIAALSQGVPCVGVAYSMKFAGVFESVGVESWVIDGRNVSNEAAVSRVLDLYRARSTARATLVTRAADARSRLKKVFEELVMMPSAER